MIDLRELVPDISESSEETGEGDADWPEYMFDPAFSLTDTYHTKTPWQSYAQGTWSLSYDLYQEAIMSQDNLCMT